MANEWNPIQYLGVLGSMKNGPYTLVIAPEGYPGKKYRDRYCYEHHLVWWQNTKEVLSEGECIHHKNEDKRDNRFENLEKMCIRKHSSVHAKGQDTIRLTCDNCGDVFDRARNKAWNQVYFGQRAFCCLDCFKSKKNQENSGP